LAKIFLVVIIKKKGLLKMEHCLVLIKPDGVELSLVGEVLTHLEHEELFLAGSKVVEPTYELAAYHYYEHKNKPFYQDVIKYLLGGYHSFQCVYAFVYAGENACNIVRNIVGKTNPMEIEPNKKIITLRQKYGRNVIVKDERGNEIFDEKGHVVVRFENVIHASFSDASEYEIKLWFSPNEILSKYRLYETIEKEGKLFWKEPFEIIFKKRFPS